MKSQTIRLIDVLILGPVMIRSGWLNRDESPILGHAMMFAGAATIVYNWENYRRTRDAEPRKA